jgi:hypothetical protein
MLRVSLSLLALSLSACIAPQERVEPLYPITDTRPKREEVAQLGGYILSIDDRQVSEGRLFEVLPGCHVVRTPARWGRTDSSAVVTVDTGNQTFALLTRPGYTYVVEVSIEYMGSGPAGGKAFFRVTEKDLEGKKTKGFGAMTSDEDIEECRHLQSRSQQ